MCPAIKSMVRERRESRVMWSESPSSLFFALLYLWQQFFFLLSFSVSVMRLEAWAVIWLLWPMMMTVGEKGGWSRT